MKRILSLLTELPGTIWGFGAAFFLLLFSLSFSLFAIHRSQISNEWVTHTHNAKGLILSVLSAAQDAETGQRGFVMTGNDSYLKPYQDALRLIPERMQVLEQTISDNPYQVQKVQEIQVPLDLKLAELHETIQLRKSEGFEAAMAVVNSDIGQQHMRDLRGLISQMIAEEDRLLKERRVTQQRDLLFAKGVVVGTGGLSIFIGMFVCLYTAASFARLKRARDRAEYASDSKSAFLANMSHEIRTPMNGITVATELLLLSDSSKEKDEYGELIHHAANALTGIINDILDYSKLEIGKISLEKIPIRYDELVQDSVSTIRSLVEEKGLTLEVFYPQEVPRGILGDPIRLSQILMNLLSNAEKFTHAG